MIICWILLDCVYWKAWHLAKTERWLIEWWTLVIEAQIQKIGNDWWSGRHTPAAVPREEQKGLDVITFKTTTSKRRALRLASSGSHCAWSPTGVSLDNQRRIQQVIFHNTNALLQHNSTTVSMHPPWQSRINAGNVCVCWIFYFMLWQSCADVLGRFRHKKTLTFLVSNTWFGQHKDIQTFKQKYLFFCFCCNKSVWELSRSLLKVLQLCHTCRNVDTHSWTVVIGFVAVTPVTPPFPSPPDVTAKSLTCNTQQFVEISVLHKPMMSINVNASGVWNYILSWRHKTRQLFCFSLTF